MSISIAGSLPFSESAQVKRTLRRWQVIAVAGLIIAAALGLALYAAAASYESVTHLAATHGLPLPRWTPVGIDGGLFGVIALNIALTWANTPLMWLRLVARLFAIGMIAANVAAGWPDPVGVSLRIAPPVLFIVLVETAQAVLLRHHRETGGFEGVPPSRWLLAPRSTFRLWRRMKLWRIRDYGAAIGMELSRLQAIEKLTMLYAGQDWRKAAPADLAWMLLNGVHMEEALVQVAELTTPVTTQVQVQAEPVSQAHPEPAISVQGEQSGLVQDGSSGSGQPQRSGSGRSRRRHGRRRGSGSGADGISKQMEIVAMKAAEPEISNAEIARRTGVSGSYVGRVLNPPPTPGLDQQVSKER